MATDADLGMGTVGKLRRLLADDGGQDLVEYALLGAFVGVVGVLAWQGIVTLIGQQYASYNSNVPLYWEPPDPASAGS
jgi:Flp pilus assembly pilin Flp